MNLRSVRVHLLVGAWLALVGAGSLYMADYASRPGPAGVTPGTWPEGLPIPLAHERATLVMLAHPRCSCSRASLAELARLTGAAAGRLAPTVLFALPDGAREEWEESDLVRSARALSGVRVAYDEGGAIAATLGARTSGHVVVYEPGGSLVFSGGITAAHGHEGDNRGRSAILALLDARVPPEGDTAPPVFGCEIHDEACDCPGTHDRHETNT